MRYALIVMLLLSSLCWSAVADADPSLKSSLQLDNEQARQVEQIDAERRALSNIRLMRADACYAVAYLLPSASVSTYYIFFPDPWPKKKHHGNRLFDRGFLDAVCRTLEPGGLLHFATDHWPYYEEVHALLREDDRFEEDEPYVPSNSEKTDFELLFSGQPIGRCSFRMRAPGKGIIA